MSYYVTALSDIKAISGFIGFCDQMGSKQHFNNKEIAAKMGISEKTVEAQLTKALIRFRTEFGK